MAATKPNRFSTVASQRTGPKPTPGSVGEETRKYTLLLAVEVADNSDDDVTALRRRLNRNTLSKSEVVRALLEELHTSPTLMDTVAARLDASAVTPSRRHDGTTG